MCIEIDDNDMGRVTPIQEQWTLSLHGFFEVFDSLRQPMLPFRVAKNNSEPVTESGSHWSHYCRCLRHNLKRLKGKVTGCSYVSFIITISLPCDVEAS